MSAETSSAGKEISCRVTHALLMYFREQNQGSLGDLLAGLGLDESYLLDRHNWVSHALLQILYHRMIAVLHDENSVFEFARASGRFESLGLLESVAMLLGNPKLIFSQAPKYNKMLKLNGDVYIHDIGESWVVLEDRYHLSAQKTRYDCDYTRGILVGIPTVFDLPPARVEEIQCQVAHDAYGIRIWPDTPVQGARGCLYRVEWDAKKRRYFGRRAVQRAIDDLQEANRRVQDKYEEVKKLASDLEEANRQLVESKSLAEASAAGLRASEERYRFLADNVTDIIWTFSLEMMRFTYVSPSAATARGFTSEEAMQQSLDEALEPESCRSVMVALSEELARDAQEGIDPSRHRTIEVQQRCKDGSYRWAEATVSFIRNDEGRPVGLLGVTRDIAERKQADEALRRSEQLAQNRLGEIEAIYQSAPIMLSTFDKDRRWARANDRAAEAMGVAPGHLLGKTPSQVMPGGGSRTEEMLRRVIETGDRLDFEMSGTTVDQPDVTRYWSAHWVPIKDERGRVTAISVAAEEITGRKRMEEALRKSHEELEQRVASRTSELEHERQVLQTIVDNMPAFVVFYRGKGKGMLVNKEFERVVGWSQEDMKHVDVMAECYPDPEYRKEVRNHMRNASPVWKDIRMRTRDGRFLNTRWIDVRLTDGFRVSIGLDMTEQIRLEQELRQTHKMEAIGTLAGGIAHDFNNVLAIILGNAELALEDVNEKGTAVHNVEQIISASKRARDLIKQILTFSRKSEAVQNPIKLIPLIKETFQLLRGTIPRTIEMRLDSRTERDDVIADPSQIQQVLMNLATNAAHAMREEGGTLTIRIDNTERSGNDGAGGQSDVPSREYLRVSVCDTGPGMSQEVQRRIFEPFFTTKGPGQGTGMGLAVVYGIVQNHRGEIEVKSTPGKGTEFTILLPLTEERAKRNGITEQAAVMGGRERILVVDDEPQIVDMVSRSLQGAGYHVTAANSGTQALALFLDDPGSFDLVIADQTMPDMTGMALAQKMMAVRGNLPVILFTGYSEIVSPKQARAAGIREYIMKPVTKREMVQTVRRVLDESTTSSRTDSRKVPRPPVG